LLCVEPLTVGEIVAATGATQPNISKDRALLMAAGPLRTERAASLSTTE
jgi:hypothetical protein